MIATPYLNAIQKIPGDTASEKLKWLGKLNEDRLKDQEKASGDIDQVSLELQPILRVQTAVKKKKHEDVMTALKSDDVTIVRRALQASWFFDGSYKDIVDAKYFREQIFPYVSMNTRLHIIKTLALRVKDPQFAQQMFIEIESIYGIQYALPLIVMCDEEFAYSTIVNKQINLPFVIAKKICRRNIDLIVRYLRLSDPSVKNSFRVNIQDYIAFLPTLVKKRLTAFVELYEMHEKYPPLIRLSNTCIDIFLKKGVDHLIRKPQLYIQILSLNKIHATIMEKIFPALIPKYAQYFNVDEALRYLTHYPEDKKFDYLCEVYRNKYGDEFLAQSKNITPDVLLLMPVEERIKQARIKIIAELAETMSGDDNDTKAFMTWICYLPITESIPCIKRAMNKATTPEDRVTLMWQMISTCNVNKDEDALIDFINYFLSRHKNEEDWVFDRIIDKIISLYDMPHLSEKIWSALNEIILLFYVKYGWVTEAILINLIHYRLLHEMPIAEQIEMFIETQMKKTFVTYERVLQEHPYYKRQYLVACVEVLEQKCSIGKWKAKKDILVFNLIQAMYHFNEKCDKEKNQLRTKIERITIKDYPWLQRTLYSDVIQTNHYYSHSINRLFYKHEPELYRSWFQEKAEFRIEDIKTGGALKSLRQNLEMILDDWQEYLEVCKIYNYEKSVHRFIRATRWYKDLPILFVNYCQKKWQQRDYDYLVIMALLLHSDAVTKIMEPLIPTETKVDTVDKNARQNYALVTTLPLAMKVSNPPVPLELIARLCEGDYLSVALMALVNACRRFPLPKVMSFAENLAHKRVSVMKHGIRIMYMVAPIQQIEHFLLSSWQKNKHHSIRTVLLQSTQHLFFTNPNEHTWFLYKGLISTMNDTDDLLFSELNPRSVPNEYVVDYIELLFDVIHKLSAQTLPITKVFKCIATIFQMITEQICDNLKDSFVKMLLDKYLFIQNEQLSDMAINFTVSPYLLTAKEMFCTRMDIFSDIFKKKVKEGWNISHPTNIGFCLVNYTVHIFIKRFVEEAFIKEKQVEPDVISKMLETFLSALTPQMEPQSYLLLIYAHERAKSTSPEQFGLQLGTRIPDLIETFSPMFVPFMSKLLKNLPLSSTFDKELKKLEVVLGIAEGLVEADNMGSCFIAADLLLEYICDLKHHTLVKKLMDMNHPAITSLLNDRKNEMSYNQVNSNIGN